MCSICLDNTITDVQLECTHSFHKTCIERWLNTNNNCPVCRYVIPKKLYGSSLYYTLSQNGCILPSKYNYIILQVVNSHLWSELIFKNIKKTDNGVSKFLIENREVAIFLSSIKYVFDQEQIYLLLDPDIRCLFTTTFSLEIPKCININLDNCLLYNQVINEHSEQQELWISDIDSINNEGLLDIIFTLEQSANNKIMYHGKQVNFIL